MMRHFPLSRLVIGCKDENCFNVLSVALSNGVLLTPESSPTSNVDGHCDCCCDGRHQKHSVLESDDGLVTGETQINFNEKSFNPQEGKRDFQSETNHPRSTSTCGARISTDVINTHDAHCKTFVPLLSSGASSQIQRETKRKLACTYKSPCGMNHPYSYHHPDYSELPSTSGRVQSSRLLFVGGSCFVDRGEDIDRQTCIFELGHSVPDLFLKAINLSEVGPSPLLEYRVLSTTPFTRGRFILPKAMNQACSFSCSRFLNDF